ncbi:hypothetical protein CBOM_01997 [Ceraceosorus bombacis]|uniref:Uncharacterized protein n=1 Tax=Ceraceosorus bombacis TaxID=401625 RepID=A0A0P1BET6_9BASI|nr:hypothetical protein CBOM_01997 [Ceraceosorus bombacis]
MATHNYDEHDPYNDGYHRGHRIVPFRVLSLGMSRTATASTQRALVMLGFSNCYHGYRPLRRQNVPLASNDIARWMRAFELKWGAQPASGASSLKQVSRILQDVLRGRPISCINLRPGPSRGKALLHDRKFWDDLLGDCQSACDLPIFTREIWEAYSDDPEVKVVLNIRPIESWFKSVQVLGKIYEPSLSKKLLCFLDPLFCMQFEMGRRLAVHVFGYDANFKTLFRNDGSTEKVYEASRTKFPD